jgi:hypothetical protein
MENKIQFNWSAAFTHVEFIVMFLTIVGCFYSSEARIDALSAKIDNTNARFDQFMFAWHEESKDFHGRMERNDSEFRMRFHALEKEANK